MSFWLMELAKLKDELLGSRRPHRKGMAETMREQRAAAIRESADANPAAARPAGMAAPRLQPPQSQRRGGARPDSPASPPRPLRVAIELGHGGGDPGTGRNGVIEAQVVRSLAPWLNQLGGNGVIYEFWERPAKGSMEHPLAAVREEFLRDPPDIVISLHVNAVATPKGDNPKPHGAMIFYYPKHAASGDLAALLQREVRPWTLGLGGSGKMAALATWPYARLGGSSYHYPLWKTGRYAMVQVEMAFVTNPVDRLLMPDRRFAQQSAAQIDRAVRAFAAQRHLLPSGDGTSLLPNRSDAGGLVGAAPGRRANAYAGSTSWAGPSRPSEQLTGPDPLQPTPPMPDVRIAPPPR